MDKTHRSFGHANTFLTAGVIAIAVVVLGLFVLPVADCPECKWNFFGPFEERHVRRQVSLGRCETCGGRTRVGLFTRWKFERNK